MDDFYLRYYVGHQGKFGHEFLEFEFRPDGKVKFYIQNSIKSLLLASLRKQFGVQKGQVDS